MESNMTYDPRTQDERAEWAEAAPIERFTSTQLLFAGVREEPAATGAAYGM
jgi:hypothetical protein